MSLQIPKPVQPFRLGSVAPDFDADTTQGKIKFYEHIGNNWAILFCYPDDFTPVATTELVMFAQLQEAFASRRVKLVALSTNNEPDEKGDLVPHEEWVKDVDKISSTPLKFPIINDREGVLSRLYNVLDEKDVLNLNADNDHTEGLAFKSRHIFVIGPELKKKHHFRLILNYPAAVGFNTAEVLRAIDCLQTADLAGVRTPANWIPGNEVVIPPKVSNEEALKKFPDYEALTPYLRFTPLPVEDTNIEKIVDMSAEKSMEFQAAND